VNSVLRSDYTTDQFNARDVLRLLRGIHGALEGLKKDLEEGRGIDRRCSEVIHFLDVSQAIVEEIMADHVV